MKTLQQRIEANIGLMKTMKKVSFYDTERLIEDAKRYIKASKEGRLICSIDKVSSSGMSRTMKFMEMAYCKGSKKYRLYNFYALFKATGHTAVPDSDYFRISGCGMDMVFATNYDLIGLFGRLGIIRNKETINKLSQSTPPVI